MRRTPQQTRAAVRRAKFLQVAGELFEELGYEAVTMTAIAERSEASIGTLYDYFSDKPALAQALLKEYTQEASIRWAEPLDVTPTPSKAALADLFVEGIVQFAESRPGYLVLLGAPIAHVRSPEERLAGRLAIAKGLQKIEPTLTDEGAFLAANIVVELLKGFLGVYRLVTPDQQQIVAAEFRSLIRFYLSEALGKND